jgi:hypothetical protein
VLQLDHGLLGAVGGEPHLDLASVRGIGPEIMEFTWGTDRLRIELRADGAGWHECLDRLVSDLDGMRNGPWPSSGSRCTPGT